MDKLFWPFLFATLVLIPAVISGVFIVIEWLIKLVRLVVRLVRQPSEQKKQRERDEREPSNGRQDLWTHHRGA